MLAARRLGVFKVILPKQNEKDVNEDLSEDLRREITVHYVSTIDEVLELALLPIASAQSPTHVKADESPLHETVQ